MIELLACKLGRNDEAPNIELAELLCANEDAHGIREIVDGLKSEDQAVANDCIKVLYEIGYRSPNLIADYAGDFISLLSSKNNRMVWGGMTALTYIVPFKPEVLYNRLPEIIAAYENGSVITIDNSISVFAELCKANKAYRTEIFPILIRHLKCCRAKEIPQHFERISVCIDADTQEAFVKVLKTRMDELSESQKVRVMKVIKKIQGVRS